MSLAAVEAEQTLCAERGTFWCAGPQLSSGRRGKCPVGCEGDCGRGLLQCFRASSLMASQWSHQGRLASTNAAMLRERACMQTSHRQPVITCKLSEDRGAARAGVLTEATARILCARPHRRGPCISSRASVESSARRLVDCDGSRAGLDLDRPLRKRDAPPTSFHRFEHGAALRPEWV